ncbi:MAG TPA: thiamine biosynthesis protein [Patescibacteria group bacterium]|nr:thiamine biosynthesis protein [Patescibacteria group bacterium]
MERQGDRIRAIGLVSGGLDSLLAVSLLKGRGLELLGLHFYNGFSPGSLKRVIRDEGTQEDFLGAQARKLSVLLGITVEVIDVSGEFLDLIVSPRHGYGANVNPCIDCRIFMLQRARERMEREGAHFIFTGEVLGQRPMSQHRRAMDLVARRSGLEGCLLRPLSAKLLPPTVPEEKGWIERDSLLDIQGRSRKRQMALALEFGLREYEQPAGGCTLTDENYARRFKDLMRYRERPAIHREDAVLLAAGRHFRLSGRLKIIVGRDETENRFLERNGVGAWLLTAMDHPGPSVLVQGEPDGEELRRTAEITARYSDAKHLPTVRVAARRGDENRILEVAPISDSSLERLRI